MINRIFHFKLITSCVTNSVIRVMTIFYCFLTAMCAYASEDPTITTRLRGKYGEAYFHQKDRLREFSYYKIISNSLEGVCDSLGREIIPPIYDSVYSVYGYFIAEKNKKDNVINQAGINLISETSDMKFMRWYRDYVICMFGGRCKFDKEGYLDKIVENGKWGAFSYEKRDFVVPPKFDYLSNLGEGLFSFAVGCKIVDPDEPKGGKWGFVNFSGDIVIDPIYDKVTRFEDGYAQVTTGSKLTLIPNPLNSNNKNTAQNFKHREAPKANFTNDNLFVVIIGNSYYPSDIESTSALADGDLFHHYCTTTLGCPEKNIQQLSDATYANIVKAFSHLREVADVYDGDAKVIIYYSGLGATDQNGRRYLLPSDVEIANIPATSISLNTIAELFNNIKTVYSLALIDAPFDGLDKKGNSFSSHRGILIKESATAPLPENSYILTSAGQNGRAYNMKEEDVSLFTDALLSSMNRTMNKQHISAFIDNLMKKTQQASIGLGDQLQSPQLINSVDNNNSNNSISF